MKRLGKNCIWCGLPTVDSDVSHVLPECFGNRDEQVLPKGTVCRSCNNYFGSKIEPALVDDPVIHAICVAFRVVDPGDANIFRDRLFDQDHPAMAAPQRNVRLDLNVRSGAFELEVAYEVKGTIRKEYDRRNVARFSRAVHKLAFESFICLQMQPDSRAARLDPFVARFRPIRQWARYGQPARKVRPLVRMPATSIATTWQSQLWGFGEHLGLELRLFGDWLAVSLTSPHAEVEHHLTKWCSGNAMRAWLISEKFRPVGEDEGGTTTAA
jgi:hypothetical protein